MNKKYKQDKQRKIVIALIIIVAFATLVLFANNLEKISKLQKAEIKLTEYTATRNKATRANISFRKEEYGFGGGSNYGISDKTAF